MEQPLLPEIIRTARLVLRPWQVDDVDDVYAYARDHEWGRYLAVPQPYLRTHAIEFLVRQVMLDRCVHPAWAISLDGRVIGGINIRLFPARRASAMGWSLARSCWGQGLTTEAACAVIDAAFQSSPDLNRIEATADARNSASRRIMEKAGMQQEGVLRQNRVVRGELIDEAYYGILRAEWSARQQRPDSPQ